MNVLHTVTIERGEKPPLTISWRSREAALRAYYTIWRAWAAQELVVFGDNVILPATITMISRSKTQGETA